MKPIRVALSGSGFKFPAHVGALTAIHEAGYKVVEIAGTSGGSIIAALLATGMALPDMEKLCLEHDWTNMLKFSLSTTLSGKGYCSGRNLLKWLISNTGGFSFNDLPIPLSVVASDISSSAAYIFSKKNTPKQKVSLACRASTSMPYVYAPVKINDSLLMDGGVCNNMPIDILEIDTAPRLGIHLTTHNTKLFPEEFTPLTVSSRLLNLLMDSSESAHIRIGTNSGAHMVMVDTSFCNGLDRNMDFEIRKNLFLNGYTDTSNLLKSL